MSKNGWEFWIDRGGTFTDIVARSPDGGIRTHKLLSENPDQYDDAAIQGIRDLLALAPDDPLPVERIAAIKMGTTVATNALLERKGEPTLLVTTSGFGDALRIGYQNRPHLFRRKIELPEMLYSRVIEVAERVTADGKVVTPFDAGELRAALQSAFDEGYRAAAIVFMHAYRFPDHEKQAASLAREMGFTQVTASHEASPLMKFVGRGDTTVADAYLSPILRRYVDRVTAAIQPETPDATAIGGPRLLFMQSSGGLTDATYFQGKDAILSGPAGGVVGAIRTAEIAGYDRIIGFDMGGTSTDVCHYAGSYERAFETEVAGVRMRVPMMAIHTIAAGGGSILSFDGARLRVGPESAGAHPGPASYRKGGPLTVTDANVMVGKLQPQYFPRVMGPDANEPLDAETVRDKFAALAREVPGDRSPEEVADGFLAVAVENMARAIKRISVQRGYDISKYALNCFGGAGAQHACLVADALGMTSIIVHPYSSLLSAYGMGLADIRAHRDQAIEHSLNDTGLEKLKAIAGELAAETEAEVEAQAIDREKIRTVITAHLRYQGTDTALLVPLPNPAESAGGQLARLEQLFAEAHRQQFGFTSPGREIILEAVSVESMGTGHDVRETSLEMQGGAPAKPIDTTRFFSGGAHREAGVYRVADLAPGTAVAGPALLIEPHSTVVLEPEWQAERNAFGHLILSRERPARRRAALGTTADPVMLEIFNNLFMSIAEQMGFTLEKTAHSVNIKERLDFSCAVFDGGGNLVANAPHMPVHLGSMGESVKAVIRQNEGDMAPGDVFVLNAPYNGGTHLPDITVVAPVYDEGGSRILFYVAARGHHADIGGISPGSMPPDSRTVDEEGVLIDNFKLVSAGEFREAGITELLTSGPYPVRNVDQNLGDLRAQIAACEKGIRELRKMVGDFGLDVVEAYMQHVQDNAEESVRRVIDVLTDSEFQTALDDGSRIKVAIRTDKEARRATIDFTGTSPQQPTNFNAPAAVCKAAVLYVFRAMVDDDIPLNAGCLKPLDIIIPEGSLLNPAYPAAVVAGNVETSQAVTDALFGALGAMAAAQGTMNNLTFGNERYQYYETISGGAGAGPDFDGASAVQTHMTNSRLTDPEVLEFRFPVLLKRFAIRKGSGGKGAHKGGDGVIREIEFREELDAGILSTRRTISPFGLAGGGNGETGRNSIRRADGSIEPLGACAKAHMKPGDAIIIETPGGGGFGKIRR